MPRSIDPAEDPSAVDGDAAEVALWDEPGVIARACAGEERAWVELVERFGARVFAIAKSRVRRADLAEEITQSVFVTVSTKLRDGGYDDQGRFEPWLFRIAINRVRDEIRRQRRHADPTDPWMMPDREDDGALGPDPDPRTDPELTLMRDELARLSDPDREVIELRHHGQMSFKQMAALLDEPVGTLLARHHRALRKLRGAIERRMNATTESEHDPAAPVGGGPARSMTENTTRDATRERSSTERSGSA